MVAARLRAERAQADPLQLDQIKQRVIARCSASARRSTFMKSKLATIGTLLALLGGTGGAFALGSKGNGNGYVKGAATAQYVLGKTTTKTPKKCKKGKKLNKKGVCVAAKKSVKAVRRARRPAFTG